MADGRPRSARGRDRYAFEFGPEPASDRVLRGAAAFSPKGGAALWRERGLRLLQPAGFPKDSLEVDEADRRRLAAAVREALPDFGDAPPRVLVTHGTDTLLETARALRELLADAFQGPTPLTVVLTGARRPEKFAASDAQLNLGMALGALYTASPGVYVAIDLLVAPCEAVARLEDGSFVERAA